MITGYFEPNGSSDPTVIKIPGVSTVVHSATGKWTVTLDDSYYEVISVVPSLQLHTLADVKLMMSDTSDVAKSTVASFTILAYTNNNSGSYEAPAACDIANVTGHAGNRIHLTMILARRST